MEPRSFQEEIRAAAHHLEAAARAAARDIAPRYHGLLAHIERHIYRLHYRWNTRAR
jgi:hypothetical protein